MSNLAPWRIKFVRSIFAAIFLGIGILLAWAGYFHQLPDHAKVASWVKTPCKVLHWDLLVSQTSNRFLNINTSIAYQYEFAGKTYRGDHYDEATDWEVDLRDFEEEGVAARRGPAFCYVDPQRPSEASFRGPRLWFPYSLIGGGGFLALLGLIFFWNTFFPSRRSRGRSQEDKQRIVSRRALMVVVIVLLGISANLASKAGTVDALAELRLRKDLVQVPARVESTSVQEETYQSKNTTRVSYVAKLIYSYEHDGRRWHSDRWSFASTGLKYYNRPQAEATLKNVPPGLATSCWIHPEKPWLSTLHAETSLTSLWPHILPVAIALGAFFLLGGCWRKC